MNFNGLFWQQPISNGREWIFTQNPEAFGMVRSCIRSGFRQVPWRRHIRYLPLRIRKT